MNKKSKKTSYRKIYEESTGAEIPKGYVVHHLDGNRENNTIENLILLHMFDHCNCHKSLLKAWNPLYECYYVEEKDIINANELISNAIDTRNKLCAALGV